VTPTRGKNLKMVKRLTALYYLMED